MFRLNFFLVSSLVLASVVSARIIDADVNADVGIDVNGINDVDNVDKRSNGFFDATTLVCQPLFLSIVRAHLAQWI